MSTRDLIDKEVASLPEDLQRRVYDFVMRLKQYARDESFNAALRLHCDADVSPHVCAT